MERIIITDIDDVVLQWEYPFYTWMESNGYVQEKDPNMHPSDVATTYNMTSCKTFDLIKAFNSSAAIGFLPPFRDAQYYIKLLHERHQFKFIAVTSSMADKSAKKLRIRNLRKIFGNNTFVDHHILPLGSSKVEVLQDLYNQYGPVYWVEDSPEHARSGQLIGLKTLLMLHGRNREFSDAYTPVVNWEGIYSMVESDLNNLPHENVVVWKGSRTSKQGLVSY